jgi:hypothetical protein
MGTIVQFALRKSSVAPDRFGSFATGSSQQPVQSCPLCPDSVAKVPKTWTVIFPAETYTNKSRY